MTTYKISPSDLTFLWDECKRCFYLKVKYDFRRPAAPFPKIFGDLDRQMKEYCYEKPLSALAPELGEGKVIMAEKWVQSEPIRLSETGVVSAYITGKFDTAVQFASDNSYGIIDFKTSKAKLEHVGFYSRQLRAYAYALEHPAPGKLRLSPITRLGLLVFEPSSLSGEDDSIFYHGKLIWQEITLDDVAFLGFLDEVFSLLAQPIIPDAGVECAYCAYREQARHTGL